MADVPGPSKARAVPAVSRAIAILRLLGRSNEPMGMKAISNALDLVPSTALHILRVLVQEELVNVDAGSKRYSLGSGMLSLARSVIERSDFPSLVQPVLDRVARKWGVSTMGVEITASNRMVVLALSRLQTPFRLHVDVGSRFPALVSATGRLVAAFCGDSWEQLEKKFNAVRWDKPVSLPAWKKEVEHARRAGYSVDRDTYISGVTLVAVPLLDAAGKISYTLVAAGLSDQLNQAVVLQLVADLREEAQALAPLLSPLR
ncbi:IclR family transcriptional regulator [uncultured Ramlibacter sp.]|uniref:IclR family transcriptional regulator n=1 Tax=uncultured Ramlibacter sp. TaxID=260755 RepID=UPI0026221841|nr:IclR family transcriptional regulator [uncultured Ramlibacter sp.]